MKKWGTNQKRTSNELNNDLKKEPALIIMINAMLLRVLSCKALLPWLGKVHHKSPSILPADRERKISSVYFMLQVLDLYSPKCSKIVALNIESFRFGPALPDKCCNE